MNDTDGGGSGPGSAGPDAGDAGSPGIGTDTVTVYCGEVPSCHAVCCNAKPLPICGGPLQCPVDRQIVCDDNSDCTGGKVCCGHGNSNDFSTTCQPSCKDDEVVCKVGDSCANDKSCSVRFALVLGVCAGD